MKFKSFEVYVAFSDHNKSIGVIQERADKAVNAWLTEHPGIQIQHFSQSLAEINQTVVYQIGIFYSDN